LSNAYDQTLTTTSTSDTAYTTGFGGTSGATPITSGHFGIFYQMWHEGVLGNSALGSSVFANRPRAATAKAFMIATANQKNMVGTDLTRVRQGWGTVNLTNIWNGRDNLFVENEDTPLNNLQTATYRLHVPAGQARFKATMVYKDPAGTVGAAQARVNNLSLRVTSPGGQVYWGNVGIGVGAGSVSTTGGAENVVDTVENVFIDTPASGTWTVEVIGSDINTDADPTTGGTNARFALVATGVAYHLKPTAFTASPGSHVGGNLASLLLSDNDKFSLGARVDVESATLEREATIDTVCPVTSLSKLQLVLEANQAVSTTRADLYMRDWTTGQWVFFGGQTGGLTSDAVIKASQTTNLSRFIRSGDRLMRVRVHMFNPDMTSEAFWISRIDQFRFEVNP